MRDTTAREPRPGTPRPSTLRLITVALCAAAFTASLLSCATTVRVHTPEGFAAFEETPSGKTEVYRAVTPEGMKYRVRSVDNYPPQSTAFWAEALKNHLEREGYRLIGEGENFSAGGTEGVVYEWGVPYGNENYIYLTAVLVYPETILIAEAAGEAAVYRGYREALIESLASVSLE